MKQLISLRYRAFFLLLLTLLAGGAQASIPSGMLSGDRPSLNPMLKKVQPAVVNVVVTGKQQQAPMNPLFNDPFFRQFFNMPEQRRMHRPSAIGSGVIIDADKGYLVTNYHVVHEADKIQIRLNDNRQFKAKIIGTDPDTDLAVLKIDADDLTELPLADSNDLKVGDFVVAVGNPFGLRQTVTSGIVSALGRHISRPQGVQGSRYQNFIQTDASINPGNSGGALVNLEGELVGVNSEILSQTGGNIGIGFAIPANMVKSVAEQLIKHGKVERGQLGIFGQDLTPELAEALKVKDGYGVAVTQVVKGSPAAKAGLKARDVIIKADGQSIEDFADLQNAIGLRSPGDKIKLTVLRDGKEKSFTSKLSKAKGSGMTAGPGDNGKLHDGLAGAEFGSISRDNPLHGQAHGVEVKQVRQASPAAMSGLRPGDVITSVNRHSVRNTKDLYKLATPDNRQILLHVRRGPGALFLLIQ